jgi:hypothetical protein
LLEGTGKKLRHVNINDPADLQRPALKRLMKRAVAHRQKGKGYATERPKTTK